MKSLMPYSSQMSTERRSILFNEYLISYREKEKNEIWKIPNVSFYSESEIYPKLLLPHISNLRLNKVLCYQWNIVLADFAQTFGTTYSIQPNLTLEENIHLGNLQKDIRTITDNILDKLKFIARQLLQELNHSS